MQSGPGDAAPPDPGCLVDDQEALLAFFAFPAEHWRHLRTSNLIESPFATVRLRQRVTKGAGSRTKGLLMAYKLLDMAQRRWRRLNVAHLLPLGCPVSLAQLEATLLPHLNCSHADCSSDGVF